MAKVRVLSGYFPTEYLIFKTNILHDKEKADIGKGRMPEISESEYK